MGESAVMSIDSNGGCSCELAKECVKIGKQLVKQAEMAQGVESDRLFNLAYEKFATALDISPDLYDTQYQWGKALITHSYCKDEEETECLLQKSCRLFISASEAAADENKSTGCLFCDWGFALYMLADIKSRKEAEPLLEQACRIYETAYLEDYVGSYRLFNLWGIALTDLGKLKSGEDRIHLLELACEKFKAAVELDSDNDSAYINWGNTLTSLADLKEGEESDQLCEEAYRKYFTAVRINPHDPLTRFCWAYTLANQAENKDGDEADTIFEQSYRLFEAAVQIDPEYYEALHNWALALLDQSQKKDGEQASHLRSQAIRKLEDAARLGSDLSMWVLAATYGELGDEAQCREWLLKYKAIGYLDKRDKIILERRSDFESVRDKEWFKQLLIEIDSI